MMSSSSAKIDCFNPNCKEAKPEKFRKGWRLRNGEFSELCDRCASAYEEGIYCDTFHSDAAGWRSCESCGKRVHCGCIVSFHAVALLEVGGVECIACANKNFIMAPNPMWPSPFFMHLPLPERLKDLSVKNWNQLPGPSAVAAQWRHAPNLWNTAMAQSELHSRMPYEIDKSNGIDKLISGDHPSASAMEKMKSEDPSEIVASSSLKFVPQERYANGNAGDNDPVERKKGVIAEPVKNTPAAGINYEAHSSVNMAVQSTSKDDTPSLHVGFDLPYASPNETNGPSKVSAPQSVRKTPPSAITKPSVAGPHNGVESSAETQVRNGRLRGDSTRARHQLLPRYWPRITDQELQQISGDSNSVITPLFEKMLSASDAGRIGRLVLPKKCAEAYFPAISQPEGLPLKVQDARGKEWIFQFRFWPNNNSRMYVLEGVTPCIQSMQLQAGDTVTFSRIDPEGKLVMGFRKASNVPPSDQETQTPKSGNGVPKTGEVNSADPSVWSKVDKSGYIAKEIPGTKASLPTKRKSSTLGSKSKRLRIENEDLIELKITWEEAQELLRPSPNHDPNVVMLEGLEIEEYEEAPILGRPTIFTTNQVGVKIQWVQCEDCSKWRKLPFNVLLRSRWTCSNNSWDPKRSTCSSPQELTTKQLEDLLSSKKSTAAPKKTKAAKQVTEAVEASVGLDTLANLAIPGEGDALPSSSQATTKHPRHRPGCTCIVCIQPPSGKGPKHKQTCTCNVCLTVKRRFRTLMLRHEKRRSEKEAETARKKDQQLQQSPKPEPQDDPPLNGNTSSGCSNPKHMLVNEIVDEDPNRKRSSSSPLKGQIDLNIQPEREDEPSSASDSCSKRLIRDANERYLREQKLSSSASGGDPIMIK